MKDLGDIRIAIAGVGNCTSSLLQGIQYYKQNGNSLGLLHEKLGSYGVDDIRVVAAFDIDVNKIGKDVSEAIYAEPNKAPKINEEEKTGVMDQIGPSPDIADAITMSEIKKADAEAVDVASVLKEAEADVLVNLISGGSDKASRLYS